MSIKEFSNGFKRSHYGRVSTAIVDLLQMTQLADAVGLLGSMNGNAVVGPPLAGLF